MYKYKRIYINEDKSAISYNACGCCSTYKYLNNYFDYNDLDKEDKVTKELLKELIDSAELLLNDLKIIRSDFNET